MSGKQAATISGDQLRMMLLGAYQSFKSNYERINNLNVFPVPDGDTGTNMLHTMNSVAETVGPMEGMTVGEIGQAAARSAVLGARGNSGVILSQLLYGLGKGLAGKESATNNEIGKSFQYGILYAYRAVSKPVEGTILTVARGIAKGAYHAVRAGEDLTKVLEEAIEAGKVDLARTPELLPALKEAGVVDAGGQGLIVFFEGCLAALRGEVAPVITECAADKSAPGVSAAAAAEEIDLRYPYCTEFIIRDAQVGEKAVRGYLSDKGDSMIVGAVYDIIKVHVHTADPGAVLAHAIGWGTLHDIKIDNMADQHKHLHMKLPEKQVYVTKKGIAVITVAAGEGIAEIMRSLGAEKIISGGQSMNPPVEAFVQAVENGAAERYIILPNNKNIILAVQQVKKLLGARHVDFIPTVNLAQGLAALLAFDKGKSMVENVMAMKERAKGARSAACSIAVRDSVVNGVVVTKGQYVGMVEDKIVCAEATLAETAKQTLTLADGDSELISVYYGSEISRRDVEQLVEELERYNPEWTIELFNGGQPLYHLVFTLE